ncbi:uncharacterized protein MYCFIDRAFT_168834 [Pseudocercospora fijiensis CIRAD86]|uniref:N-acetyltransferase domain-containing protein n=1 Tax=Pseudocercospora fijiensis (strain CIRAD86) TaxID=383855 RepID=M2ZE42_PSEFD|nr:uncharacterized protein MYCFIDRAFT_168834 [Pseudocercospora fijiensis CIRAD86]EME77404.1 hypothetical protein MYCFIDRAFT_168834 [Pseudocercospora fijiensis CIRAD86]
MPIRIERSSPFDDGEELVAIGTAAFATDALHQSGLPPNMTEAQMKLFQEWRVRLGQHRAAAPNRHQFKAVDSASGKIVGLSAWNGPTSEEQLDTTTERYPGIPEFVNLAQFDHLSAVFAEARKKVMGDRRDYWFLASMAVHPDHQGRGIASQLVLDGLKLVDADRAECYLESTPSGRRVYEKAGFVVKDEIPQLDGTYALVVMVRPAKGASASHGSIAH